MAIATDVTPEIETATQRFQAYVDGVLNGSIVVGRYVRLQVERHVADLKMQQGKGIWFDEKEVDYTVKFMEFLKHSKGEWAGKRLRLEPWQVFIAGSLFGWKHRDDNRRRYNTSLVVVGRKNGKSTFGAAIGLRLFAGDKEPGAEIFTFATKKAQAKIVHEEAKRMVRSSPELSSIVTVLRDNLSIESMNSKYVPLGADDGTEDGLNVSGAIGDEIHAHPSRWLWDVLETGTGARRSPLMFGITTAGDADDTEGLYFELKDWSVKVLENVVDDDSWFAYIAQMDTEAYSDDGTVVRKADNWRNEANWIKSNPNIGVSVKFEDLKRQYTSCDATPARMLGFQKRRLNMEVASYDTWIYPAVWRASAGGEWYDESGLLESKRESLRGRECWVGIDLSSVSDLTGAVFVFPNEDDSVDVIPLCWCPRDNAVGRQRDKHVPYMAWAKNKLLYLTSDNCVDYRELRRALRVARDEWGWSIQGVPVDPHNARQTIIELRDEDGFDVFEHQQGGVSMNDPIKQTERLILEGKLHHGGHRVLEWCVSNVVFPRDAMENRRFSKDKAREKIDLAVAMAMAVGQAVLGESGTSWYETNSLEVWQ